MPYIYSHSEVVQKNLKHTTLESMTSAISTLIYCIYDKKHTYLVGT
jgi:hypothetical protein